MSNSKKCEFHMPFIKCLAFIGLVTIVSMISTHYFIKSLYSLPSNSTIYTSHQSSDESDSGK